MSEEIFKPIFGSNWNKLPLVMRKHYANRPYSHDIAIAEGKMDFRFGIIFKIFLPFFRALKLLVPYQGKDIFTKVTFRSEQDSKALCFDREFHFPQKKPVHFFSRMIPIKENKIIEVMQCKIGWRFVYSYENNKIFLTHRGYNLSLFGFFIPLPITFLVGKGYAEEEALSEDEFRMKMMIKHFLFGIIYEYKGQFKMVKNV